MAATFGNNTIPTAGGGVVWSDINTGPYQVAEFFSSFPGGTVTDIYCYFAGDIGSVTARLCVWDGAGNLVIASGSIGVAQGSRGSGGQGWQHANVGNINLPAGGYYVGWWRTPSQSHVWSKSNTASYVTNNNTTAGTLSGFGFSNPTGQIGAYFQYFQGGIKCYDGAQWIKHPVKCWDGGQWLWHPVKMWTGAAWQHVG